MYRRRGGPRSSLPASKGCGAAAARLRFVHAADVHLGRAFRGLAAAAPDLAPILRRATRRALGRVVDAARIRGADFLIIAGDLFDADDRSVADLLAARDALASLGDVPVVIACGNHDPASEVCEIIRWPANVRFFPAGEPGILRIERDGALVARISGLSHGRRGERDNLARRLAEAGAADVAVLHANAGGLAGQDEYAPCAIDDLIACPVAYVALGHAHRRAILRPARPAIAYAGPPQATSFAESGSQGILWVEIVPGAAPRIEFVPADIVRFAEASVSIDGLDAIDALRDRMAEEARTLAGSCGDDGVDAIILRWAIDGSGPLHEVLAREGAIDDLAEALRATPPADPIVWTDSIERRTCAEIDLDRLAERHDLAGKLVRITRAADEDPSLRQEMEAALAPLRRAVRGEVEVPDWRTLLPDALALALRKLDVSGGTDPRPEGPRSE
ncbi:MAG: DNA repair exonuclease [Planctomycetes bacterium]|nr:DNA repair exonuclease [Planctomycetota bacterium]